MITFPILTTHSKTRAQQRGIRQAQIQAVTRYADMERNRGGGCVAIWISNKEIERLGPVTPEGIPTDRLRGLYVLLGPDQACITVARNRERSVYLREAARRR